MRMEESIWVLNPDYHFKNDIDRICLYSNRTVDFNSDREWISYIHPTQAMILGIFTTDTPLFKQYESIANHFHITIEDVDKLINPYLGNKTSIYTLKNGVKLHFPKNVLIPFSEVIKKREKWNYDFTMSDLQCDIINLRPDRSHLAPHSILWMLTNKCMTNCKYCYADKYTKYTPLRTEESKKIIDEAHQLKVNYIDIIGGEIFLKPDWDIIIKKLVDYKMSPSYISTKLPLTTDIIKRLSDTGYNQLIQISLDAVDDRILSQIIGSKDGYISKLKFGIKILESYGFNIQINTILTALNCDKQIIYDIYQYVKDIENLTLWEIRVPTASLYSTESFSQIMASRNALNTLRTYILNELAPKSSCKIAFSSNAMDEKFYCGKKDDPYFDGGLCGALENRLFILPDGKVSICEQLYWHPDFIIGDLREQSLTEIWNSPRAKTLFEMKKSLFREESLCTTCQIFNHCTKIKRRCVVKVMKAYGEKNWDYPDPRCQYAPKFDTNLIYR